MGRACYVTTWGQNNVKEGGHGPGMTCDHAPLPPYHARPSYPLTTVGITPYRLVRCPVICCQRRTGASRSSDTDVKPLSWWDTADMVARGRMNQVRRAGIARGAPESRPGISSADPCRYPHPVYGTRGFEALQMRNRVSEECLSSLFLYPEAAAASQPAVWE